MKGLTLNVAIGALIGIASMAANAEVCEVVQAACVLPSDDVASRATVRLGPCSATLIADPDGSTQTTRFITAQHCVELFETEVGATYQSAVTWLAIGTCGNPAQDAESAANPEWPSETARIIAIDKLNDLALVEVDRSPPRSLFRSLGCSTDIQGCVDGNAGGCSASQRRRRAAICGWDRKKCWK